MQIGFTKTRQSPEQEERKMAAESVSGKIGGNSKSISCIF